MAIIDPKLYEKLDPSEVSNDIDHFANHIHMAWDEAQKVIFRSRYKNCQETFVIGMGPAACAAEMIKYGYEKMRKCPLHIVEDGRLPRTITNKSLVILTSFSGNTKEVVFAAQEARRRRAKIVIVASRGSLLDFARDHKYPYVRIAPDDERVRDDRYTISYLFGALLGALTGVGVVSAKKSHLLSMSNAMFDVMVSAGPDQEGQQNPAISAAQQMKDNHVIILGSEHLTGSASTMAFQLNTTSRHYSSFLTLPSARYRALNGLRNVKDAEKYLILLLHSELYHPYLQDQYEKTAQELDARGVKVIDYRAKGEKEIEECAEVLQFGAYLSYYLALLKGERVSD